MYQGETEHPDLQGVIQLIPVKVCTEAYTFQARVIDFVLAIWQRLFARAKGS